MTVLQLETDLAQKKQKLGALVEQVARAADAHVVKAATASEPAITGRRWSEEETASIKALQAECLTITEQLERARGEASMLASIREIAGTAVATPHGAGPDRRSLGVRFTQDALVRAFFAQGGHRRAQWTSPQIEATHWRVMELQAATLTTDPASGGALVQTDFRPGLIGLPQRGPVVADLCAPGTTTSNLVSYMKETSFINAADAVKEGLAKPESTLIFAPATAPVRKLAHWIPVSEEMLEDAPATASIIDSRLRWGVEIKEEDELLNGSGIDPHILGFNNLPGLAPAVPLGTDTVADAMLKQITAIAVSALIMPDGFVMNPSDWLGVQIAKNQQGNYLGAGPWAAPQAPMLWGISGAITPAQVAGIGLVGGFRSSSQIFRRSGITVEASNSHVDFFIKNLVAIRAEERLALAVDREGAFGQVTDLAGPVVP